MIRRLVLLLALAAPAPALATCLPAGHDATSLAALRQAGFAVADDSARNALALALVGCLGDPDPTLRDGVGYEALTTWLRAGQLAAPTRQALLDQLQPLLAAGTPDPQGFLRPFAALVLSEVARTDRVEPWLSPGRRADLVDAAAGYVEGVRDYRGFDAHEGWRHGVAHGADLLLQLALNPALDKGQLDRLLAAVAGQVVAADGHFYIYGEPARLARPVLYVALRGLHDEAAWRQWLQAVAAPAPLPAWDAAFASQEGLAKRHNTLAFLQAVYVGSRDSENPTLAALAPLALDAIKTLP